MKLEPKFFIAQNVWVIHEGKAKEYPVYSINITVYPHKTEILYCLNVGTDKDFIAKTFNENQLFITKEELINSLD